jgi:hypothetical protein
MVFELRKSVHGIKRYDKKPKTIGPFWSIPLFGDENF